MNILYPESESENEILLYLLKAIQNDDAEFEAIISSSRITKPIFMNLLDFIKQKYDFHSETNTLDITLDNSTIRSTIEGVTSIKKYCKGILPSEIPMQFMDKQRFYDLLAQKDPFQAIHSPEYNFRINLKSEKNLLLDSSEAQEILASIEGAHKYMRYKKRFSFTTHDNLFRIDLTAVKEGKGISFLESKILNKEEQYELEIEFIGMNKIDGVIPLDTFLSLFYSEDTKSMEKYTPIFDKILHGNSVHSETFVPKVQDPIPIQIDAASEYQNDDISDEIYPSAKVLPKVENPFSLIHSDYWKDSQREWLYEMLGQDKNLKLIDTNVGDGDYPNAPQNEEYYVFQIFPEFTTEEIQSNKELQSSDPELQHIIQVPKSLFNLPQGKEVQESAWGGVAHDFTGETGWGFDEPVSADTSKLKEAQNKRENDAVILNVLKVLNYHLEQLLQIVEDTQRLVPKSKQTDILKLYRILTKQESKFFTRFIGPQPVSMSLNELNPENSNSILSGYVVTEKADGVRAALLIDNEQHGYLITTTIIEDNKQKYPKIIDTGLLFTGLNGLWLLDGELITNNKSGVQTNTVLYKIFDVYYAGDGASKWSEHAFTYPWIRPKSEIDEPCRSLILDDFMKTSSIVCISGLNNLIIDCKEYYSGPTALKKTKSGSYKKLSEMGKECQRIFSIDHKSLGYGYRIDGLIFLPMYSPVQSLTTDPVSKFGGSWSINYKWKPPDENTIDFKISIMKDDINPNKNKITSISEINDTGDVSVKTCYQVHLIVAYDISKDNTVDFNWKIITNERGSYSKFKVFSPPGTKGMSICNIPLTNGKLLCKNGEEIIDDMIVEMAYKNVNDEHTWIPLRTRPDKPNPQLFIYANDIWSTIVNPVHKYYIEGKHLSKIQSEKESPNEAYYLDEDDKSSSDMPLRKFHNYLKRQLIQESILMITRDSISILDTSIGRGGDLNKYFPKSPFKDKTINFFLGLDISSNVNEAAKRFYREHMKKGKAMFFQYDTSQSIRDGSGLIQKTTQNKHLHDILFSTAKKIPKSYATIEKKYENLGKKGFDIISSQFSFHYYFESEETFRSYLQNVSENCHKGGYFIGTCYDGNKVFDLLQSSEHGLTMNDELDNLVFSLQKDYDIDSFDYDPSNKSKFFGQKINVYMNSIGQEITEYLVNFDLVTDYLQEYGFEKVSLKSLVLNGNGIGSFEPVIESLDKLYSQDRSLKTTYKDSLLMNRKENTPLKILSGLNNWFVFQKK